MSDTVTPQVEQETNLKEIVVKGGFKGTIGPLEDEIQIRKFAEKHKNTPNYNGAFKQVLIHN
jgi:hypothetical protein